MTAYRAVGFHTRLRGMDWTAAAIMAGSIIAAMVLLAAAGSST